MGNEEVVPASELQQPRARIREVERPLAKKRLEAEVLKEVLYERLLLKKTGLEDAPTRKRGLSVKRIADTSRFSRSNLYKRQNRDSKCRCQGSDHKVEELGLFPPIQ
jgi:hypothetical protein